MLDDMSLREGFKKPASISILVILMKNLLPPNLSPVKSSHCSLCSTHTSHLHKTKSDDLIYDVMKLLVLFANLKLRWNWLLWNFMKWCKSFFEPLDHVGRFFPDLWYSANKCQLLQILTVENNFDLISKVCLIITGTIYFIFKVSYNWFCELPASQKVETHPPGFLATQQLRTEPNLEKTSCNGSTRHISSLIL